MAVRGRAVACELYAAEGSNPPFRKCRIPGTRFDSDVASLGQCIQSVILMDLL